MNGAKIQLSSGHSEGEGTGGTPFYHNIKTGTDMGMGGAIGTGWTLSPEESAFVADPAWILMKNRIIVRTVAFFAELGGWMQGREPAALVEGPVQSQASVNLQAIRQTPPRISKGENYKGLPYVVLDYPRRFGRDDVFAIRTLFWWGNYFSVTLHLKGRYKDLFLAAIRQHISVLGSAGFHIGISDDEWRHELEEDNYRALTGMDAAALNKIFLGKGFLKLSAKCGLQHGEATGAILLQLYYTVIQVINSAGQ
jgi:hypothetical protein